MQKRKPQVSTWIQFHLESSDNLPAVISKSDHTSKWSSAIAALASTEGFVHMSWGRIAELGGQAIVVVVWEDRDALGHALASEVYKNLLKAFSSAGKTSPKLHIIDFGAHSWWSSLQGRTSITRIYFKSPLGDDAQSAISQTKGLVYPFGIGSGAAHMSAITSSPIKGWQEGIVLLGNQPLEVLVWCHFWRDEENENTFKAGQRTLVYKQQNGISTIESEPKVLEKWEADIKGAGALNWEEIHCFFQPILKMF